MAFFKRLFSPEAGSKAIDAITTGIDHANFTPQERAELKIKHLQSVAAFKVVQRILVSAIAFVWVLLILQYSVAIWFENESVKAALLDFISTNFVWGPTLAGFGLYLGGGLAESAKPRSAKPKG